MLSACFIAHGLLFFLLLVLITREKKLRLVFFWISINHILMNWWWQTVSTRWFLGGCFSQSRIMDNFGPYTHACITVGSFNHTVIPKTLICWYTNLHLYSPELSINLFFFTASSKQRSPSHCPPHYPRSFPRDWYSDQTSWPEARLQASPPHHSQGSRNHH